MHGKRYAMQRAIQQNKTTNFKQQTKNFLEFSYVSWYDNLLKKYVEVEKF